MTALEGRPGVSDVAVFGGGLHVTLADPDAGVLAVREALATKSISVQRFEPIPPSMEDVFVAMIEREERKAA